MTNLKPNMKSDTDPIKLIRKRINQLIIELQRVDLVQVAHDDDTTYSQSYDEKERMRKEIRSKLYQNEFALEILLTLNTFEK